MILMRMELNLTSNVNMVLMSALEIRWQNINIVCYVRIQLQVLACALWFVEEPALQVPFMECLVPPYFDWSQNYWVREIHGMPGIASFGNVCHIIQIAWLEKQISSSLNPQVKTHEMPDWGLASCIDSLNLASPSADRILGCANGGEVRSLTLFWNEKIRFYVVT